MSRLDVPCPVGDDGLFFFLPGCGIQYCTNVTDMSFHVTIQGMKTSHRPNIIWVHPFGWNWHTIEYLD